MILYMNFTLNYSLISNMKFIFYLYLTAVGQGSRQRPSNIAINLQDEKNEEKVIMPYSTLSVEKSKNTRNVKDFINFL